MSICKSCNSNNTDDSVFCSSCGASILEVPKQPQQAEQDLVSQPYNQSQPQQYNQSQPQQYNQNQPQQYNQNQPPQYNQNQPPQYNQNQQVFGANNAPINIPPGYNQKSRMAGGLLGIFLGAFGVGRFYLGYTLIGVLQLVATLTLIPIFIWIPFVGGWTWGFIDGILIITGVIKTDKNGYPLKD